MFRSSLFDCTQVLLRTNVTRQKLTHRNFHTVYRRGTILSKIKPLFHQRSNVLVVSSIRNASDTASPNKLTEENLLELIPDVPVPVPENETVITKILEYHANGELKFSCLDLGGWTPSGVIQHYLEWLHISGNLPWWASIGIVTLTIRTLMLPLILYSQRNSGKMAEIAPKIQELYALINEAKLQQDHYNAATYSLQLQFLLKEHNYNPIKSLLPLTLQIPMFLSAYIALKGIVNTPVESMTTGGILWFTDLTVRDPYYILPLTMGGTMLLTFKTGTDGITTQTATKFMKYVLLSMPVVTTLFTLNFPSAIVYYWLSSNIIGLCQIKILRIPKVAKYLDIPVLQKKVDNKTHMERIKSTAIDMKKSFANMKYARQLTILETKYQRQYKEAGQGPIPRTFTYNPRNEISKQEKL